MLLFIPRSLCALKGVPIMIGTPKFRLGQALATPGALQAIKESGQDAAFFLNRHVVGDWGEVCQEDAQLNDEALKDGGRIISACTTLKGEALDHHRSR